MTMETSDNKKPLEKEGTQSGLSTLKKTTWDRKNPDQIIKQSVGYSNRYHGRHRLGTEDIVDSTMREMKEKFNCTGLGKQKKNIEYHLDVVSRRDKDVIKVNDEIDGGFFEHGNKKTALEKGRGFFASRHIPYRCLGSPELDPIRLTMHDFMHKRRHRFQNKTKVDKTAKEWLDQKLIKDKLKVTKVNRVTNQCDKSERHAMKKSLEGYKKDKKLKRAGMDTICKLLNESSRRINAVRAGQPYSNVLKNDINNSELIKTATEKGRDMVIIPISKSDELNAAHYFTTKQQNKVKDFQVGKKHSTNLVEQTQKSTGIGVVNLNILSKVMRVTGKVMQKTMQSRLQICNTALARYEHIYMVLCGILNIRSRDLKKRCPLERDVVKQYLKHPNSERIARINFAPFPRSRRTMNNDSDSSEDFDDSSECATRKMSRDHYSSRETASCLFDSSAKHFSNSRWKPTTLNLRHPKLDDGKPQTWDDLLTVEFKTLTPAKHHHAHHRTQRATLMTHPHGHLATLSGQMGHTFPHHHAQFTQRNVKNKIVDSRHIPIGKMSPPDMHIPDRVMVCERRPAPWQLISNRSKNEHAAKKQVSAESEDQTQTGIRDSKQIGKEKCKENQSISRVIEATNVALEQQKNEMLLLARHKMATFDQTPVTTTLFQNHRTRMEDAKSYLRWFTSGMDEVPVAEWYEELQSELEHHKQNQFKSEKQCDIIKDLETKMKNFAYADYKNLPRGREKLCLLVYSLPAELLFKHQMYNALRFVQKKVLRANEECIDEWLTERKIPVTKTETNVVPQSTNPKTALPKIENHE